MRRRYCCLLLVSICWLSGCIRSTVSGKYLAKFENGAYWLQLIETNDGHITGQFEIVVLSHGGRVESDDWGVTGAADGRDVSLSLQPLPGIPLLSKTASGTLSWHKLRLSGNFTGQQAETVEFVQSDQQSFVREIENVTAQSRTILATRAKIDTQRRQEEEEEQARRQRERQEAELINDLHNTLVRIRHFETVNKENIPKFAAVEQRYAAITEKMEHYLNHERQLWRNPNAGADRAQIVVAMNQGTIANDQLHIEMTSAVSEFESKAGGLSENVAQLEQRCGAYSPTTNTVSPLAASPEACREFAAAVPSLREQFHAAAEAFVLAEQKYRREHDNQVHLLAEAERIE